MGAADASGSASGDAAGAQRGMSADRASDMRVRVLLADGDDRARSRIREVLESDGLAVVAEARDGAQVLHLSAEHQPDVVLIDADLPGNGIRATGEITRQRPQIAVVMLSAILEEEQLFDALRAGAAGYLPKDIDPRALCAALRGVLAGEAALPRRMVTLVMDEFRAPSKRRFARSSVAAARLSAREWEIMQLLGSGRTTDEVARELFLSPTTVRVHVSAVLKKLRVADRQSALRLLREE